MLKFITGTYFSAKKEYINSAICRLLGENKRVYLIVPEQSSFDRDRDFLFEYGEKLSNMLTVTSFTHLTRDVLEEYGLQPKPQADEAARSVIMSLAAEECADSLDIYKKYTGKPALVKNLLGEYGEIKQAGLGTEDLFAVSKKLPDSTLKNKTRELAGIFSAYEALITDRFSDATDNIPVMTEFLKKNNIFGGAYVFFDDFRGFTGAQIKLIAEIVSQAQECFISVYAPDSVNAYDSEAFRHAVSNCRKLRAAATLKGVDCREEKIEGKLSDKALSALSESLFCGEKDIFSEKTDSVTVISAENMYRECDTVALQIKNLLEEGLRCKDIAVYDRDGSYVRNLTASLKKYSIPVFQDKRVSLFEYPLVRMILSAVSVVAYGFKTEEILGYIKTGITGISVEECALLENYVYVWQTEGGGWAKPFTGHPYGYGEKETPETKALLQRINGIRSRVTEPLYLLRKNLSPDSEISPCKALFLFLKDIEASENFREYAEYLYKNGAEATAIECASVWDTVTEALDALNEALKDKKIGAGRFYELLKIIFSSVDIGRIPAGIDEIVIGQAGRTRHLEPRAVFVLGCNEGIFPQPPHTTGLFSPAEKRKLCSGGFLLENIPENAYAEERMIAYSVLTGAGDRLFVSYSENSPGGAKLEKSEIVNEIREILPDCEFLRAENLSSIERIGSTESAFAECASLFRENTPYSASLKEYIAGTDYAAKLKAVKTAADNLPFRIENRETATKLFSEDMYISPSKAEVFYSCAFRYFCQYGMKVKQLRTADLDVRINGLLIHHVLEKILLSRRNKELTLMTFGELTAEVDAVTEGYVSVFMGGSEDKSVLLKRSIAKAKETAVQILLRMIEEFRVSRFETVAVELKIAHGKDIEPYVIKLPDGGSVTISGSVDRVDVYNDEGKAYIRVVDYKTGGKDFNLGDVFSGLNMQMLIYLMCIWDNGKEKYGDTVPAGIMYVPANNAGDKLSRRATDEDVASQKLKNGRMNGMILEDEKILDAMEEGCKGTFINASIDEKGKWKGTFLSYEGFRLLHGKIDSMLTQMGLALHSGEIEALPVIGTDKYKNTCKYCDYKDVCRKTETDEVKAFKDIKHPEAVKMLEGSENDG